MPKQKDPLFEMLLKMDKKLDGVVDHLSKIDTQTALNTKAIYGNGQMGLIEKLECLKAETDSKFTKVWVGFALCIVALVAKGIFKLNDLTILK